MSAIINKKASLKKYIYRVLFLILGVLPQILTAQNRGWQKATVLPGSKIKVTARPVFSDCWAVDTNAQKYWYKCTDINKKSPHLFNEIKNKVSKNYDFTISKESYLYIRFDFKTPKGVAYYEEPSFALYKKIGKEWQNVWIKGSIYSPTDKQQYRITPDGFLKYYDVPPHYTPAQYRLVITSATRNNTARAERVFVPSSINAKVYVVPFGFKININPINTGRKLSFSKKWHVNEKIKLGLARVVAYLRRRADELSKTKPSMSALFRTYADRIFDADFYYVPKYGSGEANCTRFFHNINLFDGLVLQNPIFEGKKAVFEDKDLGTATSSIIHEISHKYGANEWQAHYLQKLTFDDLKIPKYSWNYWHTEKTIFSLRKYNNQFFKKYPKNTILAEFYRWTVK